MKGYISARRVTLLLKCDITVYYLTSLLWSIHTFHHELFLFIQLSHLRIRINVVYIPSWSIHQILVTGSRLVIIPIIYYNSIDPVLPLTLAEWNVDLGMSMMGLGEKHILHRSGNVTPWWLDHARGHRICMVITLIVVEDSKTSSGWHGDNPITRNTSTANSCLCSCGWYKSIFLFRVLEDLRMSFLNTTWTVFTGLKPKLTVAWAYILW